MTSTRSLWIGISRTQHHLFL